MHERLGLDEPVLQRYLDWLGDLVHGDLGRSYRTNEPVTRMITERLPVTGEIVLLTILLSLLLAIPIGIYSAYRANGLFDQGWALLSSLFISFPPFVSSLALVFVMALTLGWLPATGWSDLGDGLADNLRYVALPVITLALYELPQYARILRADMVATLQEDFILSARAKGVPVRRILLRHALRPSSVSLLTLASLSIGRLIGGAVIVESIFAVPGVGQLIVVNIQSRDVVVVQGVVMFVALVYVVINSSSTSPTG